MATAAVSVAMVFIPVQALLDNSYSVSCNDFYPSRGPTWPQLWFLFHYRPYMATASESVAMIYFYHSRGPKWQQLHCQLQWFLFQ
jgi:hypothetical protein